jgi:SpoIID/LytB domain protein
VNKLIYRGLTILLITGIFLMPVAARSSNDVQGEIDQQNQQLAELEAQLAQAQAELDSANSVYGGAAGELAQLEAEIKKIGSEIERNKLQLQLLSKTQEVKELEKEERTLRQVETVTGGYINWRAAISQVNIGSARQRGKYYQSRVIGTENQGIETLAAEIIRLEDQIGEYKDQVGSLESQNEQLAARKRDAEIRVAQLQSQVVVASGSVTGLQSQTTNVRNTITRLTTEQQTLQEYENWILQQAQGSGGSGQVEQGQIYFESRGRDAIQGHQVGMSQYGAQGAALSGYSASQILQFYYSSAYVTDYPETSEITVRYCQGNPALVAYQEGCWSGGSYWGPDVTTRISFQDYLAWLGEMPESWHPEARKAQMIAARTYAIRFTNNGDPNMPICLTTYCQVSYVLSGNKYGNWSEIDIVQETAGKVVTYAGQLIETLYSAENNQGFGTADASSMFQNIYGDAEHTPYLVGVNDNAFAAASQMYSWNYYCDQVACRDFRRNTNGYTYAQVKEMLLSTGRGEVIGMINAMGGEISLITFERDATNHIRKVVFTGTNGVVQKLGGWWFKNFWNNWVFSRGSGDYIYSQTFRICVNNNGQIGCDAII